MGEPRRRRSGLETRERIIDAALETVRREGLVGTSARVIARTGGFNQALVFYHFGSVDELLLEALCRANDRRIERFRERLEAVGSLAELVDVAIELHEVDTHDDQAALVAIVAGWSSNDELGPRVAEILHSWDDLVEGALLRSLEGTPLGQVVPTGDLAHAVSSLFLGISLLGRLEGNQERTASLFATLSGAARLAEPLFEAMARAPQR